MSCLVTHDADNDLTAVFDDDANADTDNDDVEDIVIISG